MKTRAIQFIRIISFIWSILVVAPLLFLMFALQGLFQIANNFTYHSFIEYDFPSEWITGAGYHIYYYFKFYNAWKVLFLIVFPIIDIFGNFYSSIKTIRF